MRSGSRSSMSGSISSHASASRCLAGLPSSSPRAVSSPASARCTSGRYRCVRRRLSACCTPNAARSTTTAAAIVSAVATAAQTIRGERRANSTSSSVIENPCTTTTVSRSSLVSFDRHWRSHVVATDVSDGRRNCSVAATVFAPRFPIRSAVRSSKLSMPYAYVSGHVHPAPGAKRFAKQHGVVAGGLAGGVGTTTRSRCSAWRAASAHPYPTPAAVMPR